MHNGGVCDPCTPRDIAPTLASILSAFFRSALDRVVASRSSTSLGLGTNCATVRLSLASPADFGPFKSGSKNARFAFASQDVSVALWAEPGPKVKPLAFRVSKNTCFYRAICLVS